MNKRQRHRSLRLHRETLRVLNPEVLARAAGGSDLPSYTIDDTVEGEPLPKTNAWGGGIVRDALCVAGA